MWLWAPVDYAGKVNCPEPVVYPILEKGKPARFPDDITPPRTKRKRHPDYPSLPKSIHKLSARVIVQGTIDVDGNVGDIDTLNCRVKKGDKPLPKTEQDEMCVSFTASVKFAFTDWQYVPAMRGDAPVCVRWTAAFDFVPRK